MAAKINWNRYGTKLRHCHPMRSRVYETIECPSVRLSHRSTAAAACLLLRQEIGLSIDSAVQRARRRWVPVLSSNGSAASAGVQQQMHCASPYKIRGDI